MSTSDYFTNEKIKNILQPYNDILHEAIARGKFTMIVEHDLTDTRKFTIIKDSMYDGKLEGVRLVFDNPEDFKNKFPEFAQLPPVHIPTNTERDSVTGKLQGIKKDPLPIESIEQMDDHQFIVTLATEDYNNIGCVWLRSFLPNKSLGDEDFRVTIYTALERTGPYAVIPHLKYVKVVDNDNDDDRKDPNTQKKFIPLNTTLDNTTIPAKYILIYIHHVKDHTPEIQLKVTQASALPL